MALTPTMHFEGKSDEGLKAVTNSNLRKQRVIPDGKLVYADSTNLPPELPSDTLLFTTDTRELYIGTGKSIKRVNLGNDGEIIDKTDYLTKVEAARYYVQKEALNPESVVKKVDLENSLNTINTLINQLSERADKTDDDIQNVIRDSNDKFVTKTRHEQDLTKKVNSEHLTPTGNHCFVINDTIGPTLKYQNTANSKESSINVGKDKITINFSNTDGEKVGSKLYVNSSGIYYTNSNDENFEQDDEILTKRYTLSLEGKINEVKSSIESIKTISDNAAEAARQARVVAESAESNITTAVTSANTAIDTANNALDKADTVSSNLQSALDKSTEALNKATNADTNASLALSTTTTMSTRVDEISSTANNAVSLATDANTNATEALNKATTVAGTIDEIKDVAFYARETAIGAKDTADAIAETANNAKTSATSALTKANAVETALDTLDGTVSSFSTLISQANTNADNAKTIADETKTIAQEAKTSATEAKVTANMLSDNMQEALNNSSDAKTLAQEAKTLTEGFNESIINAVDTANAAKTNADAATEIANNATSTANTAFDTAGNALDKADSVGNTVSDHETRISALEAGTTGSDFTEINNKINEAKTLAQSAYDLAESSSSYDDTELISRIEALEIKEDKDTVYDDTNIKNDIESAKSRLDNLESKEELFIGIENEISSINSAITELQNKEDKDTVYDDTDLQTRVGSLETTVTTLTSGISGEIDLTEVSTIANTAKTTAENAITKAEGLETRVKALEDAPAIEQYDDTALKNRVEALENKTDQDTIYDDTDIKNRLAALEAKEDKDTVYDDTDIKARIKALEDSPASEPYDDTDLKNRVEALENKEDKDTVYDDTDIKARVKALEDAPIVEVYDDTAVKSRLDALEAKEDKDTVYDDTVIKSRLNALEAKEDKDTVYDDTELKNRVSELETKTAEIATLKSQIATLTEALNEYINNGSSGSGGGGGNDNPPDPGPSDQYEWIEYFRVGTNVPKITGFQEKIGHTVTNEDVMGVWDEDDDELMLEAPTVELRYLGTTKNTNLATEVLTILTEDQIHDTTFMNQNILSEYPEGKKVPTVYDSEEEVQAFYNDFTTNGAIDYEDTSNGILVFTRSVVANQVYMIRKKKS